ncbi:MAG: porin family protein [Acidobacteriota bacterium]
MKKALQAALVSLALMAYQGVARADHMDGGDEPKNPHQHLDLGIFVGSITYDDVVDVDNGPLFGVRAGYDFCLHWGVEFVAAWSQSDRTSAGNINRDHEMVAVDLQYNLRFDGDQKVVPYAGVGFGAWQESTSHTSDQNELIYHGVLGVRFRASKHIALMLDVREWFVPYYNPYAGKNDQANCESAQLHFLYRF